MRLHRGARVAIVGAGPGGLVMARHALEAGFDVTVFEASDDLGGQWHTSAAHSGIWPGMRTNTSRMMTAFSDARRRRSTSCIPFAEQVQAYLRRYAEAFGVAPPIRFEPRRGGPAGLDGRRRTVRRGGRRVGPVPEAAAARRGWTASRGRCCTRSTTRALNRSAVAASLVYGNGVSGHEIASDLARVHVRRVGVSQAALRAAEGRRRGAVGLAVVHPARRRCSAGAAARQWAGALRERIVRVSGQSGGLRGSRARRRHARRRPFALSGLPRAGARGDIVCRPGDRRRRRTARSRFTDGSEETVDAVVCATGYEIDIPYLSGRCATTIGPRLAPASPHLPSATCPASRCSASSRLQGPYFPLLELQARWVSGVWSGAVPEPDPAAMTASLTTPPPAVDSHHVLALTLAEQAGVAPDLQAQPELTEALLFGPMLPGAIASGDPALAPMPRRLCNSRGGPHHGRRWTRTTWHSCRPSVSLACLRSVAGDARPDTDVRMCENMGCRMPITCGAGGLQVREDWPDLR